MTDPRHLTLPTITPDFVRELIDFAPTEETRRLGFAEGRLEGMVAVFNILNESARVNLRSPGWVRAR